VGDFLLPEDADRLQFLSSSLLSEKVVVTTHLFFLWGAVKNKGKAYIVGPKGVGKTFSLLFLICCRLTEAFVYITPQIVKNTTRNCMDLILEILLIRSWNS